MSLAEKFNKLFHPEEYEDFDDGYDENEEEVEEEEKEEPAVFNKNKSNIYDIHSSKKANYKSEKKPPMKVVVFRPISYKSEAITIADILLEGCSVVVNFEKTEPEEAARILLFLNGVAYSKRANVKLVATSTYMITPTHVEITGDEIFEEFENTGVYF